MADQCKACGAAIRWVKMRLTGKPNPLNAEPAADGNVRVHADGTAEVVPRPQRAGWQRQGVPLYTSHFATCPEARSFRRG